MSVSATSLEFVERLRQRVPFRLQCCVAGNVVEHIDVVVTAVEVRRERDPLQFRFWANGERYATLDDLRGKYHVVCYEGAKCNLFYKASAESGRRAVKSMKLVPFSLLLQHSLSWMSEHFDTLPVAESRTFHAKEVTPHVGVRRFLNNMRTSSCVFCIQEGDTVQISDDRFVEFIRQVNLHNRFFLGDERVFANHTVESCCDVVPEEGCVCEYDEHVHAAGFRDTHNTRWLLRMSTTPSAS